MLQNRIQKKQTILADCYWKNKTDNISSKIIETKSSICYQPSSSSGISTYAPKKQSRLYNFKVDEVVDSYELSDDVDMYRKYVVEKADKFEELTDSNEYCSQRWELLKYFQMTDKSEKEKLYQDVYRQFLNSDELRAEGANGVLMAPTKKKAKDGRRSRRSESEFQYTYMRWKNKSKMSCVCYGNDLVYIGIYRMVEVTRFYIPFDHYNFDVMVYMFGSTGSVRLLSTRVRKHSRAVLLFVEENRDGMPVKDAEDDWIGKFYLKVPFDSEMVLDLNMVRSRSSLSQRSTDAMSLDQSIDGHSQAAGTSSSLSHLNPVVFSVPSSSRAAALFSSSFSRQPPPQQQLDLYQDNRRPSIIPATRSPPSLHHPIPSTQKGKSKSPPSNR
ncbi:hypothetical protein INT45_002601 [Circinella minor]|uniref:Uncharacterized protein n=1 Tax=Circinella minor TaxID=1195481 RepID=A0A8H7VJW1_9FUNG|nr:hypothetical protein INT45_002601 [Circinella minor]